VLSGSSGDLVRNVRGMRLLPDFRTEN
jgi:hypothetical protein